MVELCYAARDYSLLNSSLSLLSKKHGQLKGVVQALVEQAMGWLEEIKEREGIEKWLELIETVRSITEGKVRDMHVLNISALTTHRSSYLLDLPGDSSGTCNSALLALS